MEKEYKYKYELFDYEEVNDILYVKKKKDQSIFLTINEGKNINKTIFENQIRFLSDLNEISKSQKESIIIKSMKPQYFQNYNFYTKNEKIWNFNKNLLIYIFRSETMKSLFLYIFPEVFLKEKYLFQDDEIFGKIFHSIIFVPYALKDAYAITNKRFLKIFINGLPPDNNDKINLINGSSSFQILGFHEIAAHWVSAYCSYIHKNNDLYKSVCYDNFPIEKLKIQYKKKNLSKLDGGSIIEKILFSRVMHNTDIREILFILCKKSYNNTYIKFNQKFRAVSKMKLEDVYNEAIQDNDLKEYLKEIQIDLNYLNKISDPIIGLKMKRNGEIIRYSLCDKMAINRNNN